MTALHQFVPTFEPGAVGGHVLEVRKLALDLGLESEVFAEHLRYPGAGCGRDVKDHGRRVAARPGDVLVYQAAIGSTVADVVRQRPERLVVNYHNVTPERFFARWEPAVVYALSWGRAQLAELAGRAEVGVAVSRFNEAELVAAGYARTEVVPVLVDTAALLAEADDTEVDRMRSAASGPAWLFVGRMQPNKAIQDLVKALAVARRVGDPATVLRLVGSPGPPRYLDAVHRFVAAVGLQDAVEWVGPASAASLAAHYRAADVYVSASDHEGFCVPLLEAMAAGLPIVAYGAAAVPETLDGAGLCLPEKSPATFAAAAGRVSTDAALRAALVDGGRRRLAELDLAVTRARMADVITGLIAS